MPYPHVMHTGTRRIEFDPVLKLIRETPLRGPSPRIRRPTLRAAIS